MLFTSGFASFVLVCPSNCGLGCFILITAINPDSTSSPVTLTSLKAFSFFMYSFIALVSAVLNPVT
jgi:hypothetical protein